jgi:hypothetical protein
MADPHRPVGGTVFSADRDWTIHRCAHGCVHITFDRIMVTLTDHEFRVFAKLVSQAFERLADQECRQMVARPH